MKSYGRAPTFLLATGYEQVRSIAAHLAGADATAQNLNLSETGVCSGVSAPEPGEAPSCGVPDSNEAQDPSAESESCSTPSPEPVGAGAGGRIGASTGVLHGRSG